jgi:hypothetical protein
MGQYTTGFGVCWSRREALKFTYARIVFGCVFSSCAESISAYRYIEVWNFIANMPPRSMTKLFKEHVEDGKI